MAMERKNRPVRREKKVIGGTAHVGRREGAGPVGGSGGAQRSGGSRKQPSLLTLIILAAVVLLGGGGGLGALLGGGSQGGQQSDLNSLLGVGNLPAQNVTTTATHSAAQLNTSVAPGARDKRVALAGDGTDTTAVLVYMCGTDLESNGGFATKDLQEMAAAEQSDNVKVLVYTGGCRSWQNSVIDKSKNQIYQVRDGGLALLWENDTLQPMTDPGTLAGFIQWSVKNVSADRYELIFWDHGGGSLSGYGYDEVYANAGSMTLDGIAQALKAGGCTFDFIGFDACLMATLETAVVVEPYADYLIASEETEPGCGWYYTDWLTALAKDPSMPALDMGKRIADSFVSVCGQVARGQQATLSVIDLAELAGTVPEPFQDFAQAATASIKQNNYQAIASARGKTKEFAQSNGLDQVDLIHLSDNIATTESKALAKVLRSAVKYNATSSNIQNANGVSIYFPYGKTSKVNTASKLYDRIGLIDSYSDCIKSFASLEVAGQTAAGGSAGALDSLFGALTGGGFSSSSSSSSTAEMMGLLLDALAGGRGLPQVGLEADEAEFLDAELVKENAAYLEQNRLDPAALVWSEKDGQQVLALTEEQWSLVQDAELNVFVDDGEGYIDLGLDNVFDFNDDGDLIGAYDGTWLSVNGQIVAYYMLETVGTQDDYKITGRIPALLNGQEVDLMVAFTSDVPDGEVLGAAPRYDEEAETGTVARGLWEIKDGDRLDFICNYYDYQRNFQDAYYLGEPLTVNGPLTLGNIAMDNGSTIAAYRITDIYHNHYWTPAI